MLAEGVELHAIFEMFKLSVLPFFLVFVSLADGLM